MAQSFRNALVTGAASGIGLATVQRFLVKGYRVSAIDIDSKAMDRALGTLSQTEGQLITFQGDVSHPDSMDRMVAGTLEALGRVDVLVNNAGIGEAASLHETTVEVWDRILSVNLTAQFLSAKAVLPVMLEAGSGVIVNVASVAGLVGVANRAAYCASKAGVVGLTRSIAVDYAASGIRAVAVCPGTVDSPWIEKILADDPEPAKRREEMGRRQLDGRMGTPDEVAAAITYLASAEARFINGSAFVIDGGMTAV